MIVIVGMDCLGGMVETQDFASVNCGKCPAPHVPARHKKRGLPVAQQSSRSVRQGFIESLSVWWQAPSRRSPS